MLIAAIETTGETCGVALFGEAELITEVHVELPRSHDRLLASIFEQALEIAGVTAGDLDVLAVSVGPGSFTGIRIGISFTIGLALARSLPIVPVPTLDAIAYNVRDLGKVGHRSRVISMIPAGRLGMYAALYEIQPDFRTLTGARTIETAHIPSLLDENVFAAGPGARELEPSCLDCIAIDSETLTARAIGRRAITLHRGGVAVGADEVQPLYISGFSHPAAVGLTPGAR